MSPPVQKTALDLEVEAHLEEIQKALTFVCARRGIRDDDAADVIGEAFRIAFKNERAGKHWDPKVQTATLHVGGILVDYLREVRRRKAKKDRKTDRLEEGQDFASNEEAVEELVMMRQEWTVHAAAVRKSLAAQTQSGLTLLIIDAMCAGVVGRERIAEKLGRPLPVIHAAFKRLTRRLKELHGGEEPS